MARTNAITALVLLTAMTACVDQSSDDGTTNEDTSESTAALTEPVYATAHPRIYITANRSRLKSALDAGTPAATRFKSVVDSWVNGSDIWGFGAWNGGLLGQLTGNTKYCTKAVSVVDAQVAAAEKAIAAGTAPTVAGDSYLEVGDMIGDVALIYDWCYPQVSSTQRSRWIKYANQAVYNVWHPSSATWGSKTFTWSGWSTNNPSDNYYYSFLRATMLLGLATKGENSSADTWLDIFRNQKIINQLDPTFKSDLPYGASREGTGYGVSMRRLFELYTMWNDSTGEPIGKYITHTRYSMLAMIHQIVPTLDRVAPTGDLSRDSTAALFDYHRDYLQQLISIFPTDTLSKRAKGLLASSSVRSMSQSFMVGYDFMDDHPEISTASLSALNTAYHARGIGELYVRSGWDKAATWVNMIAGPYTESHAHQDQGSLMIYKGGWLAYDANVDSHSGLNQATTAHSLVRIDQNGSPVTQVASTISKMVALHQGPGYLYASADLTPAYNGKSAVSKVNRDMVFLAPNIVVVFDRVDSGSGTAQTWQLASPVKPSISGNAATFSNAGHTLKVTRMMPSSASMSTYAFASTSEYSNGYRLDEKPSGTSQRYMHVMSLDGAVSSTSSCGTSSQPGVLLNLASGGQIQVLFNRDTAGAEIKMNGTTYTLTSGVDALTQGTPTF